jgi:heat shock protein HslJ
VTDSFEKKGAMNMEDKTPMKYRRMALSTFLFAILIASACAPTSPPPDSQHPPLADTEWLLVQINGQPPLAGTQVTLIFEDANLGGMTGCNHFGGDYTSSQEGELSIGTLVQTEMYCMEPEGVMAQEVMYQERLSQASSYRVVNERLELLNPQGEVILVFE